MAKITKRSAEALKPSDTETFLWDGELRGFGLRCSPAGRKTFILQYRQFGRSRRMTLGVFGPLTPDGARELARRHLGDVARGFDPSLDRKRERKAATISALADRFLAEHAHTRCKPSTAREYERCVRRTIKPKLGTLRVNAIQRSDIAEFHHSMRETPYLANRALALLSKMLNMAEVWGLRSDGSNPTRHVAKFKERPRERFLAPDEIERLCRVLDLAVLEGTETPHVVGAYKLLLFTGCRLSEIQTLKWSYIRGDVIWLPDAKTGPRRVLLNQSALDVLSTLPRLPNNEFVIVGVVEGQHITDLQRPWRRLRKKAGLDDVRIHDLRHTYASISAMAGHSLPLIGRLLGHSQPQTTARYAHLADNTARKAVNEVDGLFGSFLTRTEETKAVKPRLEVIHGDGRKHSTDPEQI